MPNRKASPEEKLIEVKKSLENIMDGIKSIGYAKHLQKHYDKRCREEEMLSKLAVLEVLQVNAGQIMQIGDEAGC